MKTVFDQAKNLAAGLLALTCLSTFLMPPAFATDRTTIAGVLLQNGFKSQGAATTFLSEDPINGAYCYQLQPATRAQYPSVGVNFPALNNGTMASFGSFDNFSFAYDVPNQGPSADAGLRYYIQTTDGFLHAASATSSYITTTGSYNIYTCGVYAYQFSPSLTTQTVSTLSIRYALSHAGTIYFYAPFYIGSADNGEANFNTTNDAIFNN